MWIRNWAHTWAVCPLKVHATLCLRGSVHIPQLSHVIVLDTDWPQVGTVFHTRETNCGHIVKFRLNVAVHHQLLNITRSVSAWPQIDGGSTERATVTNRFRLLQSIVHIHIVVLIDLCACLLSLLSRLESPYHCCCCVLILAQQESPIVSSWC